MTGEPSNIGSHCCSPRVNSRTAPATYAAPTARCRSGVSRVGVAVPHSAVGSPHQSSQEGAALPGVHSLLK